MVGWLFSLQAMAAPRAELWSYWLASNETSTQTQTIDHSDWQQFLTNHVSEDSNRTVRVGYGSVSALDHEMLNAYIKALSAKTISNYPRHEQLAFWINLYNALTVKVILDHYPVQSIKQIDISPGWFSSGPWGKKLVLVEGKDLSLDDIEHRILRPIWKDPRIHYAVNCASVGCPDLRQRAYSGAEIEAELTQAAKRYVNHERGVVVVNNEVRVSSIYDWFEADFGGSEMAVLDHIRRYAGDDLKIELENITDISGYHYDWALNDRVE
jgi:hypothetical protein